MSVFLYVIVLSTLLGHIDSSFPGRVDFQGCYSEDTLLHDFKTQSKHLLQPFLVDKCFQLCSGNGHSHAGINSVDAVCYCGFDVIGQPVKYVDSICTRCKDSRHYYCGAPGEFALYKIEPNIIPNHLTTGQQEVETKIEEKFNENPLVLLAGHGAIYMYNVTEPSHKLRTVINVNYTVVALDYHLKRREGFAIWNDVIYRFPLFEDNPSEKALGDVYRCPTFAVDWVHDIIFFPDCYHHTIKTIDLKVEGYSQEGSIVKVPDGAWALDMVVDPYKGLLFWTTGAILMSCRLDGRGLKKVVTDFPVNRVSSLSLDLAGERVFCFGVDKKDKNTSMLYASNYTGRPDFTFDFRQYEGGKHILNFGLYRHSDYYYLKATENNYSYLMLTELRTGERPTIYLKEKDLQLNRFRLVHPKLQAPPKVDACTDRGCSHLCLMEGSQPQCYCPWYYELEHDNKTCYLNPGEEKEEPLVVKVIFGLILALIVLTGAGVLMCLFDKLWSQLHPVVVRLRGPSTAQPSFTSRRMTGTENLI